MKRLFEISIDLSGKKVTYSCDMDETLIPNIEKCTNKHTNQEDVKVEIFEKIRIELVEMVSLIYPQDNK